MFRKFVFLFFIFLLNFNFSYSLSCVDLTKNISRYQENNNVLLLQQFLFDKGYLKAKPNGYFGNGTLLAVKKYQEDKKLTPSGFIGSLTRSALKNDSCGNSLNSGLKNTNNNSFLLTQTEKPKSKEELRNQKRKEDSELIIKALYNYYFDSRGVHPVKITSIPIELCVAPKITSMSSSAEVAVIATPDSPCKDFVDISYLLPNYLSFIPRDPNYSSSSLMTGYLISRSEYNDITIEPKLTDLNSIIKIKCNFNGFCKDLKYISNVTYEKPEISSLNRNIFLRDGTPKTPFIITGKNFSATNTILLFSKYDGREYNLGEYKMTSGTATISIISIDTPLFAKKFDCINSYYECKENIPLGSYEIYVVSKGGKSNAGNIVLKGFTTSTISKHGDSTVTPKTNGVYVGQISLSSNVPVTLKSITLLASSTASNLPSKISNFVFKEIVNKNNYSGLTFSLNNDQLYENESRVYDIYVDVAEVLVGDFGAVTYGGNILVKDNFSNVDVEIPLKNFSFTVSY